MKSSLRNFGKNPVFIFVISFLRKRYTPKCLLFLGTQSSNIPNRSQPSRIPRSVSSASTSGSGTASRTRTTSKIPRAIPSPNRSRPTTPSLSRPPSSGSRPVMPSFSQSAEMINIFINYNELD